ncbi:type VI secretion system PAAR protein [Vibrio sp.]|uniref:Type VI secretion system PAAR protein n=1 Tax=Vibrio viridaestus TaxID=2487322 RepID=A0A3N9TKZ6_9VIBR|nr:type VI secretion system PAAR protein [Vibrio viridaestus]MDC0612747.1 type VI secretion system PAAR protein [Vibrio sp.]RQW65068.1 type VI secretion system PAAR protein [Vibrio viridaestus]
MGNGIVVGHVGTDHHGYPATPVISGAGTVTYDGIPAARLGDPLVIHAKPLCPPHPRFIAAGSPTVMVEGKPAARVGDPVTCGGVLIGGSSVNIG